MYYSLYWYFSKIIPSNSTIVLGTILAKGRDINISPATYWVKTCRIRLGWACSSLEHACNAVNGSTRNYPVIAAKLLIETSSTVKHSCHVLHFNGTPRPEWLIIRGCTFKHASHIGNFTYIPTGNSFVETSIALEEI